MKRGKMFNLNVLPRRKRHPVLLATAYPLMGSLDSALESLGECSAILRGDSRAEGDFEDAIRGIGQELPDKFSIVSSAEPVFDSLPHSFDREAGYDAMVLVNYVSNARVIMAATVRFLGRNGAGGREPDAQAVGTYVASALSGRLADANALLAKRDGSLFILDLVPGDSFSYGEVAAAGNPSERLKEGYSSILAAAGFRDAEVCVDECGNDGYYRVLARAHAPSAD